MQDGYSARLELDPLVWELSNAASLPSGGDWAVSAETDGKFHEVDFVLSLLA